MKRLAALEALGRGISNVRGNFEVVGVAGAGTILLLGIVLLTLVPWLGTSQDELGGLFRLATGQGQMAPRGGLAVRTLPAQHGVPPGGALTPGAAMHPWLPAGPLRPRFSLPPVP